MTEIAEAALRQLDDLRRAKAGPAFTSDLSVDEFLLVGEAGFQPLGLVVGSSIYQVGYQVKMWNENTELGVLSRAMTSGRQLAMDKMQFDATRLGADGVVGVRLNVFRHEFGHDIAEFVAIGTAVKADPRAGGRWRNWRTNAARPFTSNLSGQDFYALIKAGYAPVGMVIGACVYQIAHRQLGDVIGTLRQNVELEKFTRGLYDARELAMGRIQTAAKKLAAEGIVAMELHQNSHTWGSHTTEFLAIGTAIKPIRGTHEIERPAVVLDLS
ncbi:MAG TPA: heavy metal-binding domain-containing protein [Streptosporangiaceae bacterium]|nr:heavy metal-binding domain-containing protein [Streptosporangiaceae bacterium]